jgi:hypothetical protein
MERYITYLTTYTGDKLPPYYIGSTSEAKALSGKYFGSVTSKKWKDTFRSELKNNKHLFSITILSTHDTRQQSLDAELQLQIKNDVVKSKLFFNEAFASPNGYFGRDISGVNHPQYGKTHSESARRKMSLSLMGRITSTETKMKISKANKGRIVSDETKNKMSKIRTGTKASAATKKLMSESKLGPKNSFYNKKHSDKTKKQIAKTKQMAWVKASDEYKLNNILNQKGRTNILQYDLDGNFIREYLSLRAVERETGFLRAGINRVLKNKGKQAYGYLWQYKTS